MTQAAESLTLWFTPAVDDLLAALPPSVRAALAWFPQRLRKEILAPLSRLSSVEELDSNEWVLSRRMALLYAQLFLRLLGELPGWAKQPEVLSAITAAARSDTWLAARRTQLEHLLGHEAAERIWWAWRVESAFVEALPELVSRAVPDGASLADLTFPTDEELAQGPPEATRVLKDNVSFALYMLAVFFLHEPERELPPLFRVFSSRACTGAKRLLDALAEVHLIEVENAPWLGLSKEWSTLAFGEAADLVLEKNRELYDRLA